MKYIAIFEVPDNEDVSEGAVLMCGTKAYGANVKSAPDHCADCSRIKLLSRVEAAQKLSAQTIDSAHYWLQTISEIEDAGLKICIMEE